ncbi:MAG: phage tail sheath family protein [Rhodobacteraceae bacterium]|nr:phage tail sheath family protein [Paracoccaceae bacterium]
MYKHPGVYIEHVPSNALSIEAASTSVTAFIGHTSRGNRVRADSGKPIFISSLTQYASKFGPPGGGNGGIFDKGSSADQFGQAINMFYANGGSKAYIVPVANSAGTASTATINFKTDFEAVETNFELVLTANSPGTWADKLMVTLSDDGIAGEYKLEIGIQTADSLAEADLTLKEFETVLESFTGLSLDPNSGQYLEPQVDGSSTLVTASLTNGGGAGHADLPLNLEVAGGADTATPNSTNFKDACARLRDYRDISIMVLPGLNWTNNKVSYDAAIAHAEYMQNRMVIVDPVAPATSKLETPNDVKTTGFPTSPYTALYYPYLTVQNPYHDPETAANLPAKFDVGAAGAAAGLWGRIDGTRGVWKAPAGLEATVRGSLGPNLLIGNDLQDNLNEWGVNCIRSIIGPSVIWGGRTLATKSKPQYRYIPVRRTQNMIGESLYGALQAVVFEPNDHKLWSALRASVGDFMDGLHRAGAFQGAKASDAYFVNCGLGSTMTQGDIDGGIVRVVVGFAPLKPAEFVVVQIQQKVGQAA